MKQTVGVMGSSVVPSSSAEQSAIQIGRIIAQRNAILITGATTGLPYAAAQGAKSIGGMVIGFSPAINKQQHTNWGLPLDSHDLIIFTGLTAKGRNLLNVRASDALVFLGGSMGVLNEFTIAYDEEKILGVLTGSGGFCDHMRQWMQYLAKPGNRSVLHYNSDPDELMRLLFDSL